MQKGEVFGGLTVNLTRVSGPKKSALLHLFLI